jgi:hypothetical protein
VYGEDIRYFSRDRAKITDDTTRLNAAAHFGASVGAYSEEIAEVFTVGATCWALCGALQGPQPASVRP